MRQLLSLVAMSVPIALASAGVASAEPSVVGMTYAKAKESLQSAGVTPTIATTSGSQLAQDDCIVISQVIRGQVNQGLQVLPRKLLLSLNCYGSVATGGTPGNSAASPEGQAAKKEQAALEWRQSPNGQAWCVQAQEQHPEWFPIEGCPT